MREGVRGEHVKHISLFHTFRQSKIVTPTDVIADKPFGLTFLDVVGATNVQVSHVLCFGGPPDGKSHICLRLF